MKTKKWYILLLFAVLVLALSLSACTTPQLNVKYDARHVVHDGDTLDSLKPYLRVTYVDLKNNSSVVDEYTLSGNLNVGNNTITVTYKGLSATFDVTVVANEVPPAVKGTRDNPYTLEEAYFEAPKLGEGGYSQQAFYVKAHVGEVQTISQNNYTFTLKESDKQYVISVVEASLADGVLSPEKDDLVLVYGYLHFIDGDYANPPQIVGYGDVECTVVERYAAGDPDAPLAVGAALERARELSNNTYSEQPYYVRGTVDGTVTSASGGYSFDLTDSANNKIAVENALLGEGVVSVAAEDTVTVYGHLFNHWSIKDNVEVNDYRIVSYADVDCTVVEKTVPVSVRITISAMSLRVVQGETLPINVATDPSGYEANVELKVTSNSGYGHISGQTFVAENVGTCTVQGTLTIDGKVYQSNELSIEVIAGGVSEKVTLTLTANKYFIEYSDNATVTATVSPSSYQSQIEFQITDGEEVASLVGTSATQRSVKPIDAGYVTVVAYVGQYSSNSVTIQIVKAANDPYTNVGASGFYTNNYQPAKDYEDSYWRTKHNLMSGSIADQDQKPTLAASQPKQGNLLVRNTDENFADNGNSYKVVDYQGNVVNTIYKGGGYVTLEEVAAYVYAFGTTPANYFSSTKNYPSPSSSPWGKYLRLNHQQFSGSTSSYPYEPVLPNITGCGGTYQYYEIDIGTTGTDCDPSYTAAPYNNGSKITRGAARIVYAETEYGVALTPTERYVFYTYNHYNDFQEYLNYQGGWGQIFGNVTGGGQISSKYHYNPTPYVEVAKGSFGCK